MRALVPAEVETAELGVLEAVDLLEALAAQALSLVEDPILPAAPLPEDLRGEQVEDAQRRLVRERVEGLEGVAAWDSD